MLVRSREIHERDVAGVIDLLTHGFDRKRLYWERALRQLRDHASAPALPRYGHLLEDDGRVVGVLLMIATRVRDHNRCNLSSWYVEPAYRPYGSLLAQRAIRNPDTTYFNVSPAPHTWPILEKQGFERFVNGRIIAAPYLSHPIAKARVRRYSPVEDRDHPDATLLRDHAHFGCFSLICEFSGERYPFVFGQHRRWRFFPVAHLVYCPDMALFVCFAGSLGRYLAARAYTGMILDANGPVSGLAGDYFGDRPRYRKGGHCIRLGDIAYSEQVVFGY